jgi:hypothetical protein
MEVEKTKKTLKEWYKNLWDEYDDVSDIVMLAVGGLLGLLLLCLCGGFALLILALLIGTFGWWLPLVIIFVPVLFYGFYRLGKWFDKKNIL